MSGTHWTAIFGTVIPTAGVGVAAWAAMLAQGAARQANKTSGKVATIEEDRHRAERTPVLSAQLRTNGQSGLLLAVWLDSAEPLAGLTVIIQEARNLGGPVGFSPGQHGVSHDVNLPDGVLPAWEADTLRAVAEWNKRMMPGSAATWAMATRAQLRMSDGAEAFRLRAVCQGEDGSTWDVAVPVKLSVSAKRIIGPGREPIP